MADHSLSAPVEDVGLGHGGLHLGVAQEFLHGTDITSGLRRWAAIRGE